MLIWLSEDGLCALTIRNDGQKDVWSWYDAWEVTVTLSAMCASTAYSGTTFGLGEHISVGPWLKD